MPAVVHYNENGEVFFFTTEGETMLVIDERVPGDRVYHISSTMRPDELAVIVRGSVIGSASDARHAAVVARIEESVFGKPRLSLVMPEPSL